MHHETVDLECVVRELPAAHGRERGVRWVLALASIMMLVEIGAGYATGSMALLADGYHMATHVAALGLAAAAYSFSRRYAGHRAFSFGTGKVRALAGYTSALTLALVAVSMLFESSWRLFEPQVVDYASALPVAVIGLMVNLASLGLLHAHEGHDGEVAHHDHDHDHNHRAALMHVFADAFTSLLAIGALVAGRHLQLAWLDAVTGIVGGAVILHWGWGLSRAAGAELLDVVPCTSLESQLRRALEAVDDVRVADLHLWSIGGGKRSCMATIVTATPREAPVYREALSAFALSHLNIEVRRCAQGHSSEPVSALISR